MTGPGGGRRRPAAIVERGARTVPKTTSQTAIYPGTFDPFTNGHLDVVRRARTIFPRIVVGVGVNPAKSTLFDVKDRLAMIRDCVKRLDGIEVTSFGGLVVDFVKARRCRLILRGIRSFTDYEYEFQMALTNRSMAKKVETVFIMPAEEYSHISSRLVKEIAGLGGDVSGFVPPPVLRRIRKKLELR